MQGRIYAKYVQYAYEICIFAKRNTHNACCKYAYYMRIACPVGAEECVGAEEAAEWAEESGQAGRGGRAGWAGRGGEQNEEDEQN